MSGTTAHDSFWEHKRLAHTNLHAMQYAHIDPKYYLCLSYVNLPTPPNPHGPIRLYSNKQQVIMTKEKLDLDYTKVK
jgi:hypothetical protein